MDLICTNNKCQRTLKNIDVFAGWDERKMRAALAGVGGDKAVLKDHQEAAVERGAACPDCGNKMTKAGDSKEIVDKIAEQMAKKLRNQAVKDDLQRELADLDQFGEENWDDVQRKRVKEIEEWLEEIEKD